MSRRNRDRNPREYIRIRINQLTEERDKWSDEMDKMWFNKIIAELS